jgi:hypothetical protein
MGDFYATIVLLPPRKLLQVHIAALAIAVEDFACLQELKFLLGREASCTLRCEVVAKEVRCRLDLLVESLSVEARSSTDDMEWG